MKNIFEYKHPPLPDNCKYLVSPSMIHNFYDNPMEWYRSVRFEGSKFRGNTNSVCGTICHHIYESVTKNIPVSREEIDKQLDKFHEENPDLELRVPYIKKVYPEVSKCIVNGYVLKNDQYFQDISKNVEIPLVYEFEEGKYIAGTVDRIEGDTIVDYKTVGKKPDETCIPMSYKLQLLAYYKAAVYNGYPINRIRIVYGVHPNKSSGARMFVVTEEITGHMRKLIDNTLKLISDALWLAEKYPEMVNVIFRSKEEIA